MMDDRTNWARNFEYSAERLHRPTTVEQIQEIVAKATKAKALGSRHSFNDIANTPHDLISTEHLNQIEELDHEQKTVTIQAGIRYGDLARYLNEKGFALHNMASLPHISVAGACATATHGSGDRNGNLATAVTALELVVADGSIVKLSRDKDGDKFDGVVVNLGALGIVTRMSLQVEPSFAMSQSVYEGLRWKELEEHFDEITGSGYSVSLFTAWWADEVHQLWIKRRSPSAEWPGSMFGAKLAKKKVSPILDAKADNCNEQTGIEGSWQDRLPHFRMDFTPSSGEELQTEYLIPRRHALAAIRSIRELGESVSSLLHTSEIRTVAEDSLWLSPSYGQPAVAIHFTWLPEWPQVRSLLPQIEDRLAPFGARPHWGKIFAMPKERLQPLYPRLADFQGLMNRYDPSGKFRNGYIERLIG